MMAIMVSKTRQKWLTITQKKANSKRVGGNKRNTFYPTISNREETITSSVREFAFLMLYENRKQSNCLL
jgi:hypothetical protein